MRIPHVCFAVPLCLAAACGSERSGQDAAAPAEQAASTYAACMAVATRQPSQAETVVKASECMRLPDAPSSGSTVPAGTPPPPALGHGVEQEAEPQVRSVYTSLAPGQCRVLRTDEETGGTTSRCPGAAGHALLVHDDDARMSIDIVTPDGRTHPLNYWGVITGAFSSLGPRAEWRMRGQQPTALIVRVNASEDPENTERTTSYLAVAKVTPTGICVTDRIAPVPNANEAAQRAADASASRPCLINRSQW